MKRIYKFLILLLFASAFVGLAACGGGSNVSKDLNFKVPEGGYDGSEVTIQFYNTMGKNLTPVLETYIAEFEKLYPNIHVNYTSVGGYDDVRDQISNEITVGDQPNVAYCYPDHVALYNLAGAVTHLDDLIDSQEKVVDANGNESILGLTQEQKDDFIKGYYEEGRQFGDGFMYTMPFSKSTEVLYYNKTFFDANNLELPKTWDDMEKLCAKILEIDPNCIPLGYDSESNWFITMCEQQKSPYTSATGEHFLFDNEQNYSFVKRFRTWYQKRYVTTQAIYGAYTSGLFVELGVDEEGKPKTRSYMSIGSSAGATHQRPAKDGNNYPFEVGITTIPQVNPAEPKVISQGPSVCIFQKNNPQEVIASWLFVKYLTTSVEFQAEFSLASGYVPVIKSVSENAIYAKALASADGGDNISMLSAKVCLEQESAYYTSPAFNGSSRARDDVGKIIKVALAESWAESEVDAKLKSLFAEMIADCEYFAG